MILWFYPFKYIALSLHDKKVTPASVIEGVNSGIAVEWSLIVVSYEQLWLSEIEIERELVIEIASKR